MDPVILQDCREISTYMLHMFLKELRERTESPQIAEGPEVPSVFSEKDCADCRMIIRKMVSAFLNPGEYCLYYLGEIVSDHRLSAVSVKWDVGKYERYCIRNHITDGSQPKERSLAAEFPSIRAELRSVKRPTTVTDCYGRIVSWLLPNLLPDRIQVTDIYSIIELGRLITT